MTDSAVLNKDGSSPCRPRAFACNNGRSARRILQLYRRSAALHMSRILIREKRGFIRHAVTFVSLPVNRVGLADRDAEWSSMRKSDDRIRRPPPFLEVSADVQRHPNQCREHAATVGPVDQYPREMPRVNRRVLVFDTWDKQIRRALLFRLIVHRAGQTRWHIEDRIDRVRIVDPVCANKRRIDCPRLLTGEKVMQEISSLPFPARLLLLLLSRFQKIGKRGLGRPVLVANDGRKILPCGVLGILGRFQGMGPHMAKPAGHANPKRPNQFRIGLNRIIRVILERAVVCYSLLPILTRFLSRRRFTEEVRIRHQSQPEDPARVTIHSRVKAIIGQLAQDSVEQLLIAGIKQITISLVCP